MWFGKKELKMKKTPTLQIGLIPTKIVYILTKIQSIQLELNLFYL